MITSLNLIQMARNTTNNVIFGFKQVFVPMDRGTRFRKQAKAMNLSKDARRRLEWLIYYDTRGNHNALATCRHFNILPKVFYSWKKRFDGIHLETLEERSRAPRNTRHKEITSQEEGWVVTLRKEHIRWGKMKIARLYFNIHKKMISSWKIQYTIQKYRLYYHPRKNARIQAKRKRSQAKKRITELQKQPVSGYLIALDTIVIYWLGVKRYILTAIDSTSKIAFARMYASKNSANAADFLRRMMFLLDGKVLNALTDNGSEFHREFMKACQNLGLKHYWSRTHTPTDNPVDERFNRTLKDEFLALGNMTNDIDEFNRRLTEWLIEYTFVRPHQALGYATPWEFYAKSAKVSPMYSSSTFI
jgi:transposase InsO family protein